MNSLVEPEVIWGRLSLTASSTGPRLVVDAEVDQPVVVAGVDGIDLSRAKLVRRDKVTYHRYKADSARRSLHGIDTQVAKAERAVAGKEPVKRNRFVKLPGGDKSVNRDLEAKARAVAGLKAYITNVENPLTEFVIGAYATRSPRSTDEVRTSLARLRSSS
ncbi:hypothetical protein FHU40_003262 [Nocardioides soli]|uniref:Uncharacterized protein n=1 Tax=Nocardioides soli TaxID=1036020 RepID=A0A7W4Z1I5_9ACTN|nr:hypothetical protein [Nocardioides soli]